MKKKVLSFLLTLCMVASLLPATALAAPVTVDYALIYDPETEQLHKAAVGMVEDVPQIVLGEVYTEQTDK